MKKKIKVLFLDVDGTLTDGQIYIGQNGESFKSFHAHDAVGLRKLVKNGVETIIITGRQSEIVSIRAKEMNISEVYQNVEFKNKIVKEILKTKQINYDEAAYIGDDENDYEAILECKYKACPKNAVKKIKEISNFISSYNGGDGAVREFCEHILDTNDGVI